MNRKSSKISYLRFDRITFGAWYALWGTAKRDEPGRTGGQPSVRIPDGQRSHPPPSRRMRNRASGCDLTGGCRGVRLSDGRVASSERQ